MHKTNAINSSRQNPNAKRASEQFAWLFGCHNWPTSLAQRKWAAAAVELGAPKNGFFLQPGLRCFEAPNYKLLGGRGKLKMKTGEKTWALEKKFYFCHTSNEIICTLRGENGRCCCFCCCCCWLQFVVCSCWKGGHVRQLPLGAPPASCDLLMAAAHAHWQFERRKKGAAYSLFAQSSRAPNPPQAPLGISGSPRCFMCCPCSSLLLAPSF